MKTKYLLCLIGMALVLGCSSKSGDSQGDFEAYSEDGAQAMISSIGVESSEGGPLVRITSESEPKYNVFKLTDPDRVVIDLIDAQLSEDIPSSLPAGGLIEQVSVQSLSDTLSALVRIEVTLTGEANYLASVEGNDLIVQLMSNGAAPSESEPMADGMESGDTMAIIPPAPEEDAVAVMEDMPSMEEESADSMPEMPAESEAPEASADSQMAMEAVPEVEASPAPEIMPLPVPLPLPGDDAEEKKEEAPVAESPKIEEMPEVAEAPTPEPAPSTEEASPAPVPIIVEPEPVADSKKVEVPDPSAVEPNLQPVQTQEIPSSGLTTGTSLLTDLDSKVYTGRRVSLEFQDARVQDVIRLVAEVSKLNVIVSDDVKGSITLKLIDVPWDQALDIILTSKGLDKVQHGNILRVAPIEQLKKEREIALANDRAAKQLEPLKTKLFNVNYAEASEMSSRIKNLLSERGSVDVDARTNTLIVRGIRENLSRVENLIKVLDTQTPQVRIESRIVQASDTFARTIGVRWGPTLKLDEENGKQTDWQFPREINVGTAPDGASAFTAPAPSALTAFAVDALPGSQGSALGFRLGSIKNIFNLDLQLQYAQNKNRARIVSRPSVTVLDNSSASIIQGSKIPFLSSSSEGTSVQFQEVGISINVTPQITNDGSVLLKVNTSSNEPGSGSVGGNPIVNIRQATTEMLVKSGRTAVLGGVYKTTKTETVTGVPGLMDVPVVGWLFKGKDKSELLEELLIFITPHILSDARDAITPPKSDGDLGP